MRTIKFLTSPLLLIMSFLFIIISGKHLGGFYGLYILLALPYGWPHSLLALSGIFILLLGYKIYKNRDLGTFLNTAGAILLVLSVVSFFYGDSEGYNLETFNQILPAISLLLFAFLSLLFIMVNLQKGLRKKRQSIK